MKKQLVNTKSSAVSKENINKVVEYTKDSPLHMSICLGRIIPGLHVDIGVVKKGKDKTSYIVPRMNGEELTYFDLDWREYVNPEDGCWIVRATLGRPKGERKNKKKTRGHRKEKHG